MPGKGCLRLVIGLAMGLALLGQVVDVIARRYATSKIEQRIQVVVPDAHGVHAHIRSWPFLKVLITGHVDEMGARIDRVTTSTPLTFTNVTVELHGIRVEVQPLLTHGKVVVDRIASGTVSASINVTDLSRALGIPVTIGSGAFLVRGLPISMSVNGTSRRLSISAAGVTAASFPLPNADLLPCVPSVAFSRQVVTLSCTFNHVPAALTSLA
jgi:hypothetical protein